MVIGILIALIIVGIILVGVGCSTYSDGAFIGGCISFGIAFIVFLFGCFHGFIYYQESNDKDLARITAVTQKQNLFHTYYAVEVEYLTNTPTQNGVITNYNIEKDTFYCYSTDKELVEKLKENQYKELWIISGYKGGYNSVYDFRDHLIKDIQLKED